MTGRMRGKTAFITGAAEGLGLAVAQRFVAEGARVILADIQADKARASAQSLGDAAMSVALDVASDANWQEAIAQAVERFGGFDTLVNNAGISIAADIEAADFDHWRRVQAINSDGVFLGCHYAMPVLRKARAASITNVTSALAERGHEKMPAYCASKAAVRHLTESIALHCARSGYDIRCNSVRPGSIQTPMQDRVITMREGSPAEEAAKTAAKHPMGRIATAEEVANAILFLSSNEASFITGADLAVDGGLSL